MKSVFETDAYKEITERIKALHKNSKGQWGKMSVGQMVWHCQVPIRLANENKKYKKRVTRLSVGSLKNPYIMISPCGKTCLLFP